MIPTREELDALVKSAWSELESFLAQAAEKPPDARDASGWTVKDHVTHMAVWGDSVAVLFRGGYRHEALGVHKDFYSKASFDEINEVIRRREGHKSFGQAVEDLRRVHAALWKAVQSLPDADLARTVCDVFPNAPRTDDRRVADFIHENTATHYSEHLPWMRALVRGPA